jgi:alpha-beta hydrolase superfamily lysophospholipase
MLLSVADGAELHVYTWGAANPRGVLQLTHGMGEHALRYAELAGALNAAGWTVVAQDHRGHGANAATPEALGQIGSAGWSALVEDIEAVRQYSAELAGGLPVVLFGHSMGSFAVQQFLPRFAAGVDAVVLTGTAVLDLLEPALDLDAPLDLAMFNAPFAPARTDFDWLSRDEAQVDKYIADPLTGFGLDVDAAKQLFLAARPLADAAVLSTIPKDLPIYIAVGDSDPVNGGLALAHPLAQRYTEAGIKDVELKIYAGARHELSNETNRDEFTTDLITWLDTRA